MELLQNPIIAMTLAGALAAARVDYLAFTKFQTPTEALAYNWKVAAFRWVQGAVSGFFSALSIDAVIRGVFHSPVGG